MRYFSGPIVYICGLLLFFSAGFFKNDYPASVVLLLIACCLAVTGLCLIIVSARKQQAGLKEIIATIFCCFCLAILIAYGSKGLITVAYSFL